MQVLALAVEHAEHPRAVLGKTLEVAEGVVKVLAAAAVDRRRGLLHPLTERLPRLRVERPEDLVELDGGLHLAVGELAAVGQHRRAAAALAGRQLHVGLSEQRLLPQDRLRVLGHRGVALAHVDRDHRAGAALVELHPHDLAHVHAGDAHVRLLGERGGLGERDLELVALRPERYRAAERDPEEQQDAEARQREHHHREDPPDAWSLLGHYLLGPPQNFASVSTLESGP